jgi:hypothetical protein
MNDKHLTRLIAAAMGAATVGAVALPAQEAQADDSSSLISSLIQWKVDWTKFGSSVAGDPMFAEYHQEGYTRELDRIGNWGWWHNGQVITKASP